MATHRTRDWQWLVVVSALLAQLVTTGAAAYDLDEIPHTVWPQQFEPREITPETLAAQRPRQAGPLRLGTVRDARSSSRTVDRGLVLVLVDEGLEGPLATSLDVYVDDLLRDGHQVLVETAGAGSAEELKQHLAELYSSDDLVGALLVGDLPTAWFEVANDYNAYGYATFPIDLFYMDLDGAWTDADGNGRYDSHGDGSGSQSPEIWIGRLVVTPAMGDAADVLTAYFERNHAYRAGDIVPDGTALSYVDDDWVPWAPEWTNDVGYAFGQVTGEWQQNTTCKSDYLPRLTQTFDHISVFVHSSPDAHYFVLNGQYDIMAYTEVPPAADALFYNLFACSNANFADTVYMAGVYALQTDSGLLALGSTKTGSMMYYGAYYQSLGLYEDHGTALVQWWDSIAPYSFDDLCWFYGLTMIGDPTLRIGWPTIAADPAEIDVDLERGEVAEITLTVTNVGVHRTEWTATGSVLWITATHGNGDLISGGEELTVTISGAQAGDHDEMLVIEAPGATNNPLTVPVHVVVAGSAEICVDPSQVSTGMTPDGTATYAVTISNCGEPGTMAWEAATDVDWIAVDPPAGTADASGTTVELVFQPPNDVEGVHAATLTVSSVDAVEEVLVAVELTVSSDWTDDDQLPGSGDCSGCSGGSGAEVVFSLVGLTGLGAWRRRPRHRRYAN